MLTGSLKYLIQLDQKKTKMIIGSSDKADIQINGLGISERHCGISWENGEFYIEPYQNSRVIKIGKQYDVKFQLNNFDSLVFGASLYYLFVDPLKFDLRNEKDVEAMNAQVKSFSVEKVQQELAEVAGLINDDSKRSREDIVCIIEVIDLMPNIEEANQMSIMLDKKMMYKLIILNSNVLGDPAGKVQPYVIVKKFGTNNEWLWDHQKFIDRKSCMSEMYLDFKEDGKVKL